MSPVDSNDWSVPHGTGSMVETLFSVVLIFLYIQPTNPINGG